MSFDFTPSRSKSSRLISTDNLNYCGQGFGGELHPDISEKLPSGVLGHREMFEHLTSFSASFLLECTSQ